MFCVKLRRDKLTRLFIRLSLVSVRASILWGGGRGVMFHRNLRGRDKNPRSTNKYTQFGQLIIRKIIKRLPPDVTFQG